MRTVRRPGRLRAWLAPLATSAVVAGVALVPPVAAARGVPVLPARTARQLLVDLSRAHIAGLSGTVVVKADLGLPSLPGQFAATSTFTGLLAGTHTMHVWAAGATQERVALFVSSLSETDVVHNGNDIWIYDSGSNTVRHASVASKRSGAAPGEHPATRRRSAGKALAERREGPALTPAQLADDLLRRIDPTTRVTVDRTARVAGRAAYQLSLAPKQNGTLIRSVRIAVDAKTHVPLRIEVWGQSSSSPALRVGFTHVSFAVPRASVFRFTPPPGAEVSEGLASPPHLRRHYVRRGDPGVNADLPAFSPAPTQEVAQQRVTTTTVGKGWNAVLQVKGASASLRDIFGKAGKAVAGGRTIETSLLTAFLTDDGRLFLGSVTPARMAQVAQTAT